MGDRAAGAGAPAGTGCRGCCTPRTPGCGQPLSWLRWDGVFPGPISCPDCLKAARGMPEYRPAHDLRIWGHGLACPHCGQWGADHLDFGDCWKMDRDGGDIPPPGRAGRRREIPLEKLGDVFLSAAGAKRIGHDGCAPRRYPALPPPGFPPIALWSDVDYALICAPLCDRGGSWFRYGKVLALTARRRMAAAWSTECGRCLDAFGELPPLEDAIHDARLLPAGGAACALCGVTAAGAEIFGGICDGGRYLREAAGRRARRHRAWLPAARRTRHAAGGCSAAPRIGPDPGAGVPARITCARCVRGLGMAPLLLA